MLRSLVLLAACSCATVSLRAAPVISIAKEHWEHPTVKEGEVSDVEFRIPIMNDGDEPLEIRHVEAGCGCTSVAFDSVTPPGSTTELVATIDITDRDAGYMVGLTVQSNAGNRSQLRLRLMGDVEPLIAVGIPMNDTSALTPHGCRLVLRTAKKRLRIKGITFTPEQPGDGIEAQSIMISDYHLERLRIADESGYRLYALSIKHEELDFIGTHGAFELTTNHPDKPALQWRR